MLLKDLPDYLEWANTRTAQMLARTPTEEGCRILAHILAVEMLWAERIAGQAPSGPQRPDWGLARCLSEIPASALRYREIVAKTSTNGGEQESVHYRNTQGEDFQSSLAAILLHVFAHGAYYRGQISQAARTAGGEINDTDYILFQRQGTPAPPTRNTL